MYSTGVASEDEKYNGERKKYCDKYLEAKNVPVSKHELIRIYIRTGNIIEKYFFWKIKRKRKLYSKLFLPNPLWQVENNYITNKRIAIYTAIFGKYDNVIEPEFVPDNCDFFVVTDGEVSPNSVWKKIDVYPFEMKINKYSPAQKNRYFKMHPHELFKDYDYSIYIDGNLKMINDPSNLLSRIGKFGIAVHRHHARFCVYDEAMYFQLLKHKRIKEIESYMDKLRRDKMPINYGLLQCNIILREHNKAECIEIMEAWWDEYINGCERDQLSLPYVLFKKGISIDEIDGLGENYLLNTTFEVGYHNKDK